MYTGGPGGTGKSQIIKAIVAFHEAINARHHLKLASTIGTAAKMIGGSTIASMFAFGYGKKAKKNNNSTKLETAFKHTKTIVIDECSTLSQQQLANISQKLTLATKANPSEAFGRLDMLFFGDFLQFPPITGTPLYSRWTEGPEINRRPTPDDQKKVWSWNMWRNLTHIYLLDEQMRVQDQRYLDILNHLRESKCTDDDIALLKTRVVERNASITSLCGDPIITPGNELGMSINNLFAHEHSLSKTTYVTTAIYNNGNLPTDLVNLLKKRPNTQTQQILGELYIYIRWNARLP